jgi:hypothetical protein
MKKKFQSIIDNIFSRNEDAPYFTEMMIDDENTGLTVYVGMADVLVFPSTTAMFLTASTPKEFYKAVSGNHIYPVDIDATTIKHGITLATGYTEEQVSDIYNIFVDKNDLAYFTGERAIKELKKSMGLRY